MNAREVNFDGLVGPTHNYAGLAYGNVAAQQHQGQRANPRQAALEGLAKMALLAEMGLAQAVLPPHDRPDVQALRRLGFAGSDEQVLARAWRDDPVLLASVSSASSMWAANAATVSPAADCADGRLHLTPANLISQLHRSAEALSTFTVLQRIFPDAARATVHPPLPGVTALADEGAANHVRLCRQHGEQGLELFVYGRRALDPASARPARYPARQSDLACQAIARLHQLDPAAVCLAQQNPAAIDAGVFHNDVICVGNERLLLYHQQAFVDSPRVIDNLREQYRRRCGGELCVLEVTPQQLSLPQAVGSYFFNSQLVSLPGTQGKMALIAPQECQDDPAARALADWLLAGDNPIDQVRYVGVRQSMHNGGGPACLRLRVVLDDAQRQSALPGVFWSPALEQRLTRWVERHYRSQLVPSDLADPQLLRESRTALDELTSLLGLGSVYPFQQG